MPLFVEILAYVRNVSNLFNNEIVYMLIFIIADHITLWNIASLMDLYWFSIYCPFIHRVYCYPYAFQNIIYNCFDFYLYDTELEWSA